MITIEIPPLVSVEKTRQLLGGRGRGYVYGLMASGELDSVLDNGRRLILGESLAAYVNRLAVQEVPSHEAPARGTTALTQPRPDRR